MFQPRFKSYLSVIYVHIYKYSTGALAINRLFPFKLNAKVSSKFSTKKLGIKASVVKLQELLNIKSCFALEIVMRNMKFTKVPEGLIDNNFKLCRNASISNDTLVKYPSMLYDTEIEQKLAALESVQEDFNNTAPLLILSSNALDNILKKDGLAGLEKRVQFFCDKFNIDHFVAYDALATKPFLRNIPIKKVNRNTDLLCERGITAEDIVRDFWVLRYSENAIKCRFDKAEEKNVEKLKTWMVRGKKEIFDAHIKRKTENKLILGNNSLAEYLMQRLDCPFSEAALIIERIPAIRNKSMRKLREVIDFLYGEGFTAKHIMRVPKILLHSVATSRTRLRELESVPGGHKLASVHILTKSQRQYMQYYAATKEKANKRQQTKSVGTETESDAKA